MEELYTCDNSAVKFNGNVTFAGNTAVQQGEAIYLIDNSGMTFYFQANGLFNNSSKWWSLIFKSVISVI